MADLVGTVGGGVVAVSDTESEAKDAISDPIELADSVSNGTVGDGTVVLVKWEGSCPVNYGEVVREVPRLVRTRHG
jgi:hypothetical protein